MDRVYENPRYCENNFGNKIRCLFASKRLAELILKKSLNGEWFYTYFEIKAIIFDIEGGGSDYIARLISSNGVLLFTKETPLPAIKKRRILLAL